MKIYQVILSEPDYTATYHVAAIRFFDEDHIDQARMLAQRYIANVLKEDATIHEHPETDGLHGETYPAWTEIGKYQFEVHEIRVTNKF